MPTCRPRNPHARRQRAAISATLQQLAQNHVATVICGGNASLRATAAGPLLEWLPADADLGEVLGKLDTLRRYVPLVHGLERELNQLHRLGEQLNRYFGEIDQEMRLAGRLQRDFLPQELPRAGAFRFAAMFRPASWVSGDLYDVIQIDEYHVGVFVADAMGHGVAAGLLTMFLRQVLTPKRVTGNGGTIVPPSEVLNELHAALLRQKLPNSQFVTAVYGVLDTRTGELCLARAGHPYPALVRGGPNGPVLTEVRSGGGLLGIADVPLGADETRICLAPRDKLLLYTDGIEEAMLRLGSDAQHDPLLTDPVAGWIGLSADELLQRFGEYLDEREGSLHPADDITLLVIEASPDPRPTFG